ncbi:MAG TPA: fused MFS/spermidine synthase [Syntrophales bacterium]|nr:fused MFS/spermidine synthase [Syntrophales bacterium]HQN79412.1 fused MFS/spermidine synthase [Syntrophales bacterium]
MKRQDGTRGKTRPPAVREKVIPHGRGLLFLLLALGVQTMIVEVTIPRILAPAFGNTLFCWTAIITTVLVALSLGYYAGGILSSRAKVRRSIVLFAVFSSLWVLLLGLFGERTVLHLAGFGIMFGPLVASFLLAAVPAFLGAAVLPMVVELHSDRPGRSSGDCYALSTVGSVLGVLVTGYFLLPNLGIRGTLIVASVLVFLSLMLLGRFFTGTAGLAVCLAIHFIPVPGGAGVIFDRSNGYHRIKILETGGAGKIRWLFLDNSLEGAVKVGSVVPVLSYQKQIDEILLQVPGAKNVFFIGGGSFSMPSYVKDRHPDIRVDVAEIDPDVVRAAEEHLGLKPGFNLCLDDGRRVLRERGERYDLIVNDAFKGLKDIPFHLVTREFLDIVLDRLTPEGIYAVNVVGRPGESPLAESILATIARAVPEVSILDNREGCVENVWILASRSPRGLTAGRKPAPGETGGRTLTDDDSPVEYLVARELLRR